MVSDCRALTFWVCCKSNLYYLFKGEVHMLVQECSLEVLRVQQKAIDAVTATIQ